MIGLLLSACVALVGWLYNLDKNVIYSNQPSHAAFRENRTVSAKSKTAFIIGSVYIPVLNNAEYKENIFVIDQALSDHLRVVNVNNHFLGGASTNSYFTNNIRYLGEMWTVKSSRHYSNAAHFT